MIKLQKLLTGGVTETLDEPDYVLALVLVDDAHVVRLVPRSGLPGGALDPSDIASLSNPNEFLGSQIITQTGELKFVRADSSLAKIAPGAGGGEDAQLDLPTVSGTLARLEDLYKVPPTLKADLPAATLGHLRVVPDEVGGAVLAFADGTNWRRVTDRAIVS